MFSWAYGEESYDCHRIAMEGYLKITITDSLGAAYHSLFFFRNTGTMWIYFIKEEDYGNF